MWQVENKHYNHFWTTFSQWVHMGVTLSRKRTESSDLHGLHAATKHIALTTRAD